MNALLPLAILLLALPAHAGDRINAGNWEATMTTDGTVNKVVFCLKADEAAALSGDSKTGREFAAKKAGERCTVTAYDAAGDTVSYTLACGPRTITDVTHYKGETSEGVKTVTLHGNKTTTTIKSKRLGACPEK